MSDPVREKLAKTFDEAHGVELGARRSKAAARRALELYDASKPAPAPTPAPTPAPGEPITGWETTIAPIAAFTDAEIEAQLRRIPVAKDSPDPVGSFRLNNTPCWAGLIDPFFRRGQKRAGHFHLGFGNPEIGPDSTYASLRAKGGAVGQGGVFDRGGFWVPILFWKDRTTGAWRYPNDVTQIRYYKAVPDIAFWPEVEARSPGFAAWTAALSAQDRAWYEHHRLVELPAGLRFISGVTNGTNRIVLHQPGVGPIEAKVFADLIPRMAPGDLLSLECASSPLWDGKHIDAPDHASHMANETRDRNWRRVIDPAFPFRLPVVSQKYQLVLTAEMDFASFALSSDLQTGRAPGSTLHAEYVEGWEPAVKAMWHRHAINGHRDCAAGNLGNGRACPELPHLTPAEKAARFGAAEPFV